MASISKVKVTVGRVVMLDGVAHRVTVGAEADVEEHEVPVESLESVMTWCFDKLEDSTPDAYERHKVDSD